MHSLGVSHMHQRSDRDKYVKFHSENVNQFLALNNAVIKPDALLLGVPYDPKSLMHYKAYDLSKNGKVVMESKVITHSEISNYVSRNFYVYMIIFRSMVSKQANWVLTLF